MTIDHRGGDRRGLRLALPTLPLQAPAQEAEGGCAGRAGDRASGGEDNLPHDGARFQADPPANDDRKSAIVTAWKPGRRHVVVPDMTPEEHERRGDAADALFRELVRRVREE